MIKKYMYLLLALLMVININVTCCSAQSTADTTLCKHPAALPQFYGGYNELMNYLHSNIRFPQDSLYGLVIAEFVIEKDGTLSHIKILLSAGEKMDNEVIRLLENMPRWEPAYDAQNNPVRFKMAFPVEFKNTSFISSPKRSRKRK